MHQDIIKIIYVLHPWVGKIPKRKMKKTAYKIQIISKKNIYML